MLGMRSECIQTVYDCKESRWGLECAGVCMISCTRSTVVAASSTIDLADFSGDNRITDVRLRAPGSSSASVAYTPWARTTPSPIASVVTDSPRRLL